MGKIDMTGFNSVPDYSGYCPDCPECFETMRYNALTGEFKCPGCGYIMDEYDWDYEADEDEVPFGCRTCGGPYPDCKTSCKLFDD